MKKTIRVIIEKEIEVNIPDEMLTEEYRKDFEQSLWKYNSDNYLFHYAAEMFAHYGLGDYEGLGTLYSEHTKETSHDCVYCMENYSDTETEVLE